MMIDPTASVASSAVSETVGFLGRLAQRKGMYTRARERANELRRPLVVVGAPSGGIVTGSMAQYECGDLPCIDLGGCKECGAGRTDVQVPYAIPVADGTVVVCVQFVFEYVDDPYAAWAEVLRAAGHPTNIFVARVQGWATVTRFVTGMKSRIDEAPPCDAGFLATPLNRPAKAIARVGR